MFTTFNLFPHQKRLTGAAYGVLVLFCLAMFLPGFFSLPILDRDEASFAQASKQMVETGNVVDIRFQDEARNKKPIGIYWLQAGAAKLIQSAGLADATTPWPYRLPSLLGAILAVLLTAATGCKLLNAETGFAAAILLATSLILNVEARLAKTDAMLLACIMACIYVLTKSFTQTKPLKHKDIVIFWLSIAAGFLIKGPIILLVPAGMLITLTFFKEDIRFAKKLKPRVGIPLALALILPWFFIIYLHTHGTFFDESAGQDLFAKIIQIQNWDQNWGFALPGLYALVMPITLWPASLPFLLAIPYIWASRHDKEVRFCLAWILPVWLVFELTLTKLPHYVMPAYPALCLLAGRWLFSGVRDTGTKLWNALCYVVFTGVSLGLALLPVFLPIQFEGTLFYWSLFAATLSFGVALAAMHLFRRKHFNLGLAPLPVAGFAMMLSVFGFMLPNLDHVFIARSILQNLPDIAGCDEPIIAIAGFAEPSLVFTAGAQTKIVNVAQRVANEMKINPCVIGIVEKPQQASFLSYAPKVQLLPLQTGSVQGFNYGNGHSLDLGIYITAPRAKP
jgi:4-amino-4-deoxy-L-arabinose transferase-like glycosyltransferase